MDVLPWVDENFMITRNRVTRARKLREGWLVRREESMELYWILENKKDLVVEMEQGETPEESLETVHMGKRKRNGARRFTLKEDKSRKKTEKDRGGTDTIRYLIMRKTLNQIGLNFLLDILFLKTIL